MPLPFLGNTDCLNLYVHVIPVSYPFLFNLCLYTLQFRNFKIVYRRYAGLFFIICVDLDDNNLAYLEAIHNFVEVRAYHLNTLPIVYLIAGSKWILPQRVWTGSCFQFLQGVFVVSELPGECAPLMHTYGYHRCMLLWMKCSLLVRYVKPVSKRFSNSCII